MSEIKLVGFTGPEPFSIIFWQLSGTDQSKTICYTAQEERESLDRFHTVGDFYNSYDTAVVIRQDGSPVTYDQMQEKKGA